MNKPSQAIDILFYNTPFLAQLHPLSCLEFQSEINKMSLTFNFQNIKKNIKYTNNKVQINYVNLVFERYLIKILLYKVYAY